MKTVWILEKWKSPEFMRQTINEFASTLEDEKDEEFIKSTKKIVASLEQELKDNPDGVWTGIVGKTVYKQFCIDAKDDLRYWKKKDKNMQFRVVKAEIEDNAKYWLGYVNPVENNRVLRYLYATLWR